MNRLAMLCMVVFLCLGTALSQVLTDVSSRGFFQSQELIPSDGTSVEQFGAATALSANGSTLVVGAPTDTVNGNFKEGAAYVYLLGSGGNMVPVAKLTASDGAGAYFFGIVAISFDGNSIAIGAAGANVGANRFQGAVYVFVKPAGGWVDMTETAKLTASDGQAGDNFGAGVAIASDGSAIVVGSPAAPDINGAFGPGIVYVYRRPTSGWQSTSNFVAELSASDGQSGDNFGGAVGLSGDDSTLIVGAPSAPSNSGLPGPGKAYIFARGHSDWAHITQSAELNGSDTFQYPLEGFGESVRLDQQGVTAVVGAPNQVCPGCNPAPSPGAVYLFVKPSSGWVNTTETAKLTASDGQDNDEFGTGLSISGDGKTVLVGAFFASYDNSTQTPGPGAAYIFEKPLLREWQTTSHFIQKLTASNGVEPDSFGQSATFPPNSTRGLVIGAPLVSSGSNVSVGAVYVFRR